MAPIRIDWITPHEARARQRAILAEAGMSADELLRRADARTLSEHGQALAREFRRIDFPFADDEWDGQPTTRHRWPQRHVS